MESSTAVMALVATVTMGLAACATPAELRSTKPTEEIESRRAAIQVAECITDGWEKAGPFGSSLPTTMRPVDGGYLVFYPPHAAPIVVMAEVLSTPTGSSTRYFRYNREPEPHFDDPLRLCQR